ncbi:MAG: ABC transporter permease [Propionibacteriaceae bacterium]|jgi:ribose transport system permease protein|nr:ABC transporter permease [Propionibacteriaceae bacterium]
MSAETVTASKKGIDLRVVMGMLRRLLPFAGLALLIVLYLISTNFRPTSLHIQTFIDQVATMAIMSTGAVFIFSLGSFDISLGVGAAVSVCLGIMAYNAGAGVVGMFLVCLVVGMAIGFVNSVLSAVFRMPVFVMTIAMMSVLTATLQILLGGKTDLRVTTTMVEPIKALDNPYLRLGFVLVFFLICLVLFNFTKMGRRNKVLGGNPKVAEQTGISIAKQTILTFLISGSAVGIAAFLLIARSRAVTANTGVSLGMDVMMAIVFGGMPLAGGAYSKISAGIIGSFSMVLLSQILTMQGITTGWSQVYKAVLFLAVVFVASFSYREKMLSRAEMF